MSWFSGQSGGGEEEVLVTRHGSLGCLKEEERGGGEHVNNMP